MGLSGEPGRGASPLRESAGLGSIVAGEAVTALRKGAPLMKHCRVGKPHMCVFKLSGDEKELGWNSRGGKRRAVLFTTVHDVVQGHQTAVFRKYGLKHEVREQGKAA